jgi:hypothetical protein
MGYPGGFKMDGVIIVGLIIVGVAVVILGGSLLYVYRWR